MLALLLELVAVVNSPLKADLRIFYRYIFYDDVAVLELYLTARMLQRLYVVFHIRMINVSFIRQIMLDNDARKNFRNRFMASFCSTWRRYWC